LQSIYGTAFFVKKEFNAHLQMLEERKESDHFKTGKELEQFTNSQLFVAGFRLWLPNGETIRREIERDIVDREVSMGFDHVH
ncbi:threonine--tRNA ligase, partial [Staphylococcus aureus]